MSTTPSQELLRRLTLAFGVPGAEGDVRTIVRDTLLESADIARDQISYDKLGSLICEVPGAAGGPRVVLDAHLDEVGFLVQSITEDGRLGFVALGGWWGHVLLAQRVDVMTEQGVVPGVIGSKPPHFLAAGERDKVIALDKMYVDVGASSRADVKALGVRVGDPVAPHSEWLEMGVDGVLSSKAFDDRVGVGLLCETLSALAGTSLPGTLVGVAAVQEEVGCRGAVTASAVARPDVGIVLEGTPADDLPGFTERQGVLGKGPQIRVSDPTALSNRRLVRWVEDIAAAADIPIQRAVRRSGGTDAKSIHLHGQGVPTVVIGVPARYIHTHAAMIQWRDYEAAFRLLLALVPSLDEEAVAALTRFD